MDMESFRSSGGSCSSEAGPADPGGDPAWEVQRVFRVQGLGFRDLGAGGREREREREGGREGGERFNTWVYIYIYIEREMTYTSR